MYSGADVGAFQAALNPDIEGDVSTSQPSDSHSSYMEDSERRKERLKAMRMVAAQAEASNYSVETNVMPGSLANPLLETPETVSAQEELCATPRFDFYTDPMAAFSAKKKRSATSKQVTEQSYFSLPSNGGSPMEQFSSPRPGSWGTEMIPSPADQMQSIYSPNQRMYQAQHPYHGASPYKSPRGVARSPQAWSGSGGTPSCYNVVPYRGMTSPYPTHLGNPGFGPVGSPSFSYGQGRALWRGNSPCPGSGRGDSPSSLGRDQRQWHGGSMSPGFGQSSGRGRGRGRGFRSHNSALDESLGPKYFYHVSMVEDPWQHLKPVVWKGLDAPLDNLNTPGSSNSWLPKSISMKKPRVSEPSNKSSSQQSLAEYLAASFHEAVNDEPNV